MKTILLRTSSSNEHDNADCAFAIVYLDKALAEKILARRKLFISEHQADEELLEKYYWDGNARFYESKGELELEELEDLANDNELHELDGLAEDPLANTEEMNTECDQMILREDGVAWTMIPTHADFYITTAEIPYTLVEACL